MRLARGWKLRIFHVSLTVPPLLSDAIVTVAVKIRLSVVPQGIFAIEDGFTEIAIPTTWNGPGRLHSQFGRIVEEDIEAPGLPTVIEPATEDTVLS